MMFLGSVAVLAAFLGSLDTSSAASLQQRTASTTVNLGYATYEGFQNATTNLTAFLGMRYAAAPVGMSASFVALLLPQCLTLPFKGKLRFQEPHPPPTLSGVQLANAWPQQCPQASNPFGLSSASPFIGLTKRASAELEDCLFIKCAHRTHSHIRSLILLGARTASGFPERSLRTLSCR